MHNLGLNINTFVGIGTIVITDLYGKQVKTYPLSMGNNNVNISSLTKGFIQLALLQAKEKLLRNWWWNNILPLT